MLESVTEWFASFGHLTLSAGLSLVLLFSITQLVPIPRVLLILSTGATFGFEVAPIILIGATFGGIIAFLLSRYIASAWFQELIDRKPLLRAVAEAVDQEGWRIVALVRLGAPVPNFLQGYAFGLTKIPLLNYTLATFTCSAPQIFLFTAMGATGRASLSDSASLTSLCVAFVLTLAMIALLGWRVKRLLSSRLPSMRGVIARPFRHE